MKSRHLIARHAVLALATSGLGAQDLGWGFEVKLRSGWGFTPKDHLQAQSHGIGLAFTQGTARGSYAVELGYNYKPGDPYYVAPGAAAPGKLAVDYTSTNVGDRRRNNVEGVFVRLSGAWALVRADLRWQGGLQFGGNKFAHEYEADLRSVNWAANTTTGATDPNSWRDTYYGTRRANPLAPSPYIGLVARFGKEGHLELNLVAVTYKSLYLNHLPGGALDYPVVNASATGKPVGRIAAANAFPADTWQEKTRVWPHLELVYSFHF